LVETKGAECQSAEQLVKHKEPDAKVSVHQSVIIQGMVMNVVQSPRP
jgi:hypothetical protein